MGRVDYGVPDRTRGGVAELPNRMSRDEEEFVKVVEGDANFMKLSRKLHQRLEEMLHLCRDVQRDPSDVPAKLPKLLGDKLRQVSRISYLQVKPKFERLDELERRHVVLKERLNDAVAAQLREVSSLREDLRRYKIPLDLDEEVDQTYFYESLKYLDPPERRLCIQMVHERIRMLMSANGDGQDRLLDKLGEVLQEDAPAEKKKGPTQQEVDLLRKRLMELEKRNDDLTEEKNLLKAQLEALRASQKSDVVADAGRGGDGVNHHEHLDRMHGEVHDHLTSELLAVASSIEHHGPSQRRAAQTRHGAAHDLNELFRGQYHAHSIAKEDIDGGVLDADDNHWQELIGTGPLLTKKLQECHEHFKAVPGLPSDSLDDLGGKIHQMKKVEEDIRKMAIQNDSSKHEIIKKKLEQVQTMKHDAHKHVNKLRVHDLIRSLTKPPEEKAAAVQQATPDTAADIKFEGDPAGLAEKEAEFKRREAMLNQQLQEAKAERDRLQQLVDELQAELERLRQLLGDKAPPPIVQQVTAGPSEQLSGGLSQEEQDALARLAAMDSERDEREKLLKELREAKAQLEKDKKKLLEKIEKLKAELAKWMAKAEELEACVAEMRLKVKSMMRGAEKRGIGQEVADLMNDVGLKDIAGMDLRSVFQRLYEDFWDRMKRYAARVQAAADERNRDFDRAQMLLLLPSLDVEPFQGASPTPGTLQSGTLPDRVVTAPGGARWRPEPGPSRVSSKDSRERSRSRTPSPHRAPSPPRGHTPSGAHWSLASHKRSPRPESRSRPDTHSRPERAEPEEQMLLMQSQKREQEAQIEQALAVYGLLQVRPDSQGSMAWSRPNTQGSMGIWSRPQTVEAGPSHGRRQRPARGPGMAKTVSLPSLEKERQPVGILTGIGAGHPDIVRRASPPAPAGFDKERRPVEAMAASLQQQAMTNGLFPPEPPLEPLVH